MIIVNGKLDAEALGLTIAELLEKRGYRPDRVAVERNGEIVPKAAYAQTRVEEGDVLEIVGFVGGG